MKNETESNSLSLLKEFKSHLRKEKIVGFLKKHQKLITYLAIAVALALVVWLSLNFYNQIQSKKYSSVLHQAMIDEQNGDIEKSSAALKQIYESHAPAGVKAVASLKYAAQLLKDDKNDQAIETYLVINKNSNLDLFVREYAGLVALKFLVSENKQENHDKIKSLVNDLEKTSKNLKYYVIEQKGIFEWNYGNFKEANQIFKSLNGNPEVQEMLKKRAAEMVEIYKSKFGEEDLDNKVKDEKNSQEKVEKKDEKESENKEEKKSEEKSAEKK